jgi:Contractile injection system tube protein
MARKTGYLASITLIPTLPPLIFRFQFNPELLSEKKSYKYKEANSYGAWGFDQTSAASGFFGTLTGFMNDLNEIGSRIIATKPLEAQEGDQRTFSIDFALDATVPGPMDGDSHYNGSIEPDLAVLRAFMVPTLDVIEVTKLLINGDVPCLNRPPACNLFYGGLSVTCVMTDLNIKVTAFQDDGTASRAEVSVTLKEQSFSLTPIIEFFTRNINIAKSYNRQGFGSDVLATTPIVNLFAP